MSTLISVAGTEAGGGDFIHTLKPVQHPASDVCLSRDKTAELESRGATWAVEAHLATLRAGYRESEKPTGLSSGPASLCVNLGLGTETSKPSGTMAKECSAGPGNKHKFQVLIEGRYLGDDFFFVEASNSTLCRHTPVRSHARNTMNYKTRVSSSLLLRNNRSN